MSTLRVTNVQDTAGANSLTTAQIYNGAAKAWINFNGSGTVAIRASFNVSSIMDNGTGDYTVNFTTAMPDVSYSWAGGDNSWGILWLKTTMTTSQFRFETINGSGIPGDRSIVAINFFR